MNHLPTPERAGWSPASETGAPDDPRTTPRGPDDGPMAGLGELMAVARVHRRALILWVLFCVVATGLYALQAAPDYVATTQVVLEPRRAVLGTSDAATGLYGPALDSAQADSQIQVVKSERSLRFVFDTLDLASNPAYAPPGPGPLGRLLGLMTGGASKSADDDAASARRTQAFQDFADRVSVKRLGQSYVLEIAFRAPTAPDAARLANAVTDAYILGQVQYRAATVQRGTEFLQGRIADIKAEQDAAIDGIRKGLIPDLQFADADARVVSAAMQPLGKAYPHTSLMLLLAATFGLLSAAGFVAVRHKLDRTIRSARQIAREIGIDRLHVLPRLPEEGRKTLKVGEVTFTTVLDAENSAFATALRALRTSILSLDAAPGHLSVGIASWLPGEGRSSVASNLAFLVAASRERVALIDADFRDPALSAALAPDAKVGLDEALLSHVASTHPLAVALNRSLDFLPAVAGGKASDPNVFIGSPDMRHLLLSLRKERDIIVDLSPMSLSSDTQAIGHLLDGVLLVVEANRLTIDELHDALRALRVAKTRLLGIVLTKMPTPTRPQRRWPPLRLPSFGSLPG